MFGNRHQLARSSSVVGSESRDSGHSTRSIRDRWKWAFRKLSKDSSGGSSKDSGIVSDVAQPDQSRQPGDDVGQSDRPKPPDKLELTQQQLAHDFQRYDFKRLVKCEHCKEAITGINKIGMRCRWCKMGVHTECTEAVTAKCLPINDKRKLMKKQLSTSAIDMGKLKLNLPTLLASSDEKTKREKEKEEARIRRETDPVYQLLRCAGTLTRPGLPGMPGQTTPVNPEPVSPGTAAAATSSYHPNIIPSVELHLQEPGGASKDPLAATTSAPVGYPDLYAAGHPPWQDPAQTQLYDPYQQRQQQQPPYYQVQQQHPGQPQYLQHPQQPAGAQHLHPLSGHHLHAMSAPSSPKTPHTHTKTCSCPHDHSGLETYPVLCLSSVFHSPKRKQKTRIPSLPSLSELRARFRSSKSQSVVEQEQEDTEEITTKSSEFETSSAAMRRESFRMKKKAQLSSSVSSPARLSQRRHSTKGGDKDSNLPPKAADYRPRTRSAGKSTGPLFIIVQHEDEYQSRGRYVTTADGEQAPQSPTAKSKRPLVRMKTDSLDLPDDAERSHSSGSTSPCPSPKSQRLLPSYVYVVLQDFNAQAADEIHLRTGQMLSVIDTSDPEWWKGRLGDYVGYFPSHCVTRLHGGEKACVLSQDVNATAATGHNISFSKDQVLVLIREDGEGMSMVRTRHEKVWIPSRYLIRIS